MGIDIGKLDVFVTFEIPQTTTDDFGSPVTTYHPAATRWCSYSPVSTRHRLSAPQPLPAFSGTLICHPIDLPAGARATFNGYTWQISSIASPTRDMTVLAVERLDT